MNNASGPLKTDIAKTQFISRKAKCISQLVQLSGKSEYPILLRRIIACAVVKVRDSLRISVRCMEINKKFFLSAPLLRKERSRQKNPEAYVRIPVSWKSPFLWKGQSTLLAGLSWDRGAGISHSNTSVFKPVPKSRHWADDCLQATPSLILYSPKKPFWFHWQFCLHTQIRSVLKAVNSPALNALWIPLAFTLGAFKWHSNLPSSSQKVAVWLTC